MISITSIICFCAFTGTRIPKHRLSNVSCARGNLAHQGAGTAAKSLAFTLSELLVVIAIIAILAALLLPSLSQAKLKAYQVVCLGNLKQLNLSATMYWQDFGKGLPRDASGNPLWWRYQGAARTDTPDIRICPVAREPLPARFIDGTDGAGWTRPGINPGTAANCWRLPSSSLWTKDDWTGSYAFNGWLYSSGSAALAPRLSPQGIFSSEASVQYPTRTPVFADATWSEVWPEPNLIGAGWSPVGDLFMGAPINGSSSTFPIGCVIVARHGSKPPGSAPRDWPRNQPLPQAWGINVSFVDGHATLVKLPDIWTLTWNRTWDSPAQPGRPGPP